MLFKLGTGGVLRAAAFHGEAARNPHKVVDLGLQDCGRGAEILQTLISDLARCSVLPIGYRREVWHAERRAVVLGQTRDGAIQEVPLE